MNDFRSSDSFSLELSVVAGVGTESSSSLVSDRNSSKELPAQNQYRIPYK